MCTAQCAQCKRVQAGLVTPHQWPGLARPNDAGPVHGHSHALPARVKNVAWRGAAGNEPMAQVQRGCLHGVLPRATARAPDKMGSPNSLCARVATERGSSPVVPWSKGL
jgi:hypothetical protein